MWTLLLPALATAAPAVRSVHATSGDATQAVDADATTGWTPEGQAQGEGWVLTLDEPTALTRLQLRACPGRDSFDVAVWFDGLGAGRSVRVDPGLPRYVLHTADRPVQRVELRVVHAPGAVCLAEVSASGPQGALALAPPARVPGRVAASSVQEPAVAWAPRKAFDGRLDTAWVSAERAAGETLWLTLDDPVDIVGVELWLGDLREPGPQYPPGVPRLVQLSMDEGPVQPFDVAGAGPHLLPLTGTMQSLRLELGEGVGASPGLGLAVSEVRLWTADGPLGVALPPARTPGPTPVPDRVLEPVCGAVAGLPTRLRVRPDGTVHLAWEGQDAGGTWWTVLEGTWSQPTQDGATWSARVDGALDTWRTVATAGPVRPGAGPTLGGDLRITALDSLGDGLVHTGKAADGCPDGPTGPNEVIVSWNDAHQRMR